MPRYAESEGGWSTPSELSSTASSSRRSSSVGVSVEEDGSRDYVKGGTADGGLLLGDVEPQQQHFDREDLCSLLRRLLEECGVPPAEPRDTPASSDTASDPDLDKTQGRQSPPARRLFNSVGNYISRANVVAEWITSRKNGCFHLRVPDGLVNHFFFSSIAASIAESQPSLRLVTASMGYNNMALQHRHAEYLLASLCYQILIEHDPGWDYADLIDDLKIAFKGQNGRWRGEILWMLLQSLLLGGNNKPRVLALSFAGASSSLQEYLETVGQLSELATSTERNIKILLFAGTGETLPGLDAQYTMTMDLEAEETKQAFSADLLSWFGDATHARPTLGDFEDTIKSTIFQHVHRPLLVFSYLQLLRNRPWMTKAQLGADFASLSSPQQFIKTAFLERVPLCDRPLVSDVIGILNHCARPLRMAELAQALAVTQMKSSSDRLGDFVPTDFEYGLDLALPGLIHVEDGLVWLLYPPVSSTDNIPAWLDAGADASMRFAHACLRYISLWSDAHGDGPMTDRDNLANQWPLLNYATTFWLHHYSQAYRDGVADTEIRRLVEQKPAVIRSWLMLQDVFNPWGMQLTHETRAKDRALPAPAVAEKFGLGFPDAIAAAGLAVRAASVADVDTSTALVWSVWQFKKKEEDRVSVSAWLEKTPCSVDPASLIRLYPYQPEATFELLLGGGNREIIKQCPRSLLKTAVRQGKVRIAEECLDHVTLDETLLFELSLTPCAGTGRNSLLERLITPAAWPRSDDKRRDQLGNGLLRKAIKYGQLEVIELVLACKFNLDTAVSTTALHLATETGRLSIVQRLLPNYTNKEQAARDYQGSETPLHCASANDFLDIAALLRHHGVATAAAQDRDGDTPLHIAARLGYRDMVQLLIRTNEEKLRNASTTCPTEDEQEAPGGLDSATGNALDLENNGYLIPLEVAIQSGHDAIGSMLLQSTPRETVLGRSNLLHIAVRRGGLAILKQLLDFQGIDPDRKGRSGDTALHVACEMGSIEMAQALISHGADAWALCDHEEPPAPPLLRVLDKQLPKLRELCELLLADHRRKEGTDKMLDDALLNAAHRGDEALVTILLEAGADKNCRPRSRTPLHVAAYKGHESIVRHLLMRYVDLNSIDFWGDNPLMDAAASGHSNIVKLLLDAGATVNPNDNFRDSSLYRAAVRGQIGVVELLLGKGERFPVHGTSGDEPSPLEDITRRGLTRILETILQFQEDDFRGSDVLAECFHVALRNDDAETVSLLLKYNVNPNTVSARLWFGKPIHECAYYGNTRMARLLLNDLGKASVNSRAGHYHTPLMAAVSRTYPAPSGSRRRADQKAEWRLARQKKMVQYLISEGGNPEISGGPLWNMLNAAAYRGNPAVVEYVLDELGFSTTRVDHEHRSAFHLASASRGYAVEKLSLLTGRAGGSHLLWDRDAHGRLPLHFACSKGVFSALKHLLADGGQDRVNDVDRDGWTPLHWACRQWDVMLVDLLVTSGADPNCTSKDGQTPWDVAVFHENSDFASSLKKEPGAASARGTGELQSAISCDSCFVVGHVSPSPKRSSP